MFVRSIVCSNTDDRKRPKIGKNSSFHKPSWIRAAARADRVILTSDNPRTEDPEQILDDLAEGLEGADYRRMSDRRAAIEYALRHARPGDTVVLAGKGHETYQIVGAEKRPFDEREIVTACLAGLEAL